MNKEGIANHIVQEANFPKSIAEMVLDITLTTITKAVKRGERVNLIGFGVFKLSKRKARIGRNPKTGAPVNIPAKKVMRFKMYSDLSNLINEPIDEPKATKTIRKVSRTSK